MVPARGLLPCYCFQEAVGGRSAAIKGAGPPRQREQDQASLRRTSDLPGVRKPFRPHDSVLERQTACGVCVPGLSPEREKLLHLPPNSRGGAEYHGVGVPYGGSGQSH